MCYVHVQQDCSCSWFSCAQHVPSAQEVLNPGLGWTGLMVIDRRWLLGRELGRCLSGLPCDWCLPLCGSDDLTSTPALPPTPPQIS